MSERRSALDDTATEALLIGKAPPAPDLQQLAALVDEVRATAAGPARPSAELATRMAAGEFADVSGRATWRGRQDHTGRRPAGVPRWRRPGMAVSGLLSAVAAKVAGMGMAAKATAGLTVAAASVTGAAATGVLPDAAQERLERAVEVVTPFEFSSHVTDGGVPAVDVPGGPAESGDPADPAGFGQEVSEDAVDGGVDGQEIAEKARELGGRPEGVPASPDPAPSGKPTSLPDVAPPAGDDLRPDELPADPPAGSDRTAPDKSPAEPTSPPAPDHETTTVPDRP